MEKINNLIIVAGAGRNVGKTEFVCRLIRRYCHQVDIYALKVSAIHPDEGIYHGDHSNQQPGTNLVEETRNDLNKDTSRMLRAGAQKVYYLQGDDEQIRAGFQVFKFRIPVGAVTVCESTSLWKFVRPGLLIVVKDPVAEIKPRAMEIVEHASLVINSNGVTGFPEIDKISLSEIAGWFLEPGAIF